MCGLVGATPKFICVPVFPRGLTVPDRNSLGMQSDCKNENMQHVEEHSIHKHYCYLHNNIFCMVLSVNVKKEPG